MFNEAKDRWGVREPNFLLAALALAVIAVAISTLAHISYVTAGDDSTSQKFDARVWLDLAHGAAIGAASLLVLVRWQSGRLSGAVADIDLRAGLVLAGLTVAFALAGLFKGMDESFEALDSWYAYALVFAFLSIGWFAVSSPIPATLASLKAPVVGLVAIGVSIAALVIGQMQGLSEDNSTYLSGISFQHLGIVGMLLAFGWFLGLRPAAD